MAISVALRSPWLPIITQYIHEMGRIDAEPHGAPAIVPNAVSLPPVGMTGWVGRYGLRWAATPIGPTPGPPPPCGMQNVLCMLRWHTSAPQVPGEVKPHWAFKLAPSMYTWPPHSCVMRVKSVMVSSKTP